MIGTTYEFAVSVLSVGGTLPTVTVVVSLLDAPSLSVAVSLAVYVPSSVQVMVVSTLAGLAKEHVAPASTPAPAVYVHCVLGTGLSMSPTVPSSAMDEPSLPEAFGPASTSGGSFTAATVIVTLAVSQGSASRCRTPRT